MSCYRALCSPGWVVSYLMPKEYDAWWEHGLAYLLAPMYLLVPPDHWRSGTMTATSQHSAQTSSQLISSKVQCGGRGNPPVCPSSCSAKDMTMPLACKHVIFRARQSIKSSGMLCESLVMITTKRGDSCALPWGEQERHSWLPQPAGRLPALH